MQNAPPIPETKTLKPSRLKWIGVWLICVVFVAIGIWMIQSRGGAMSWAGTVFFGIGAVVGLYPAFGPLGSLELNGDGFEQRFLGRHFKARWDEVSDFGVWKIKQSGMTTNQFVCFNHLDDANTVLNKVNRGIAGATHQLSDTFGMKAQALADLMNQFRDRAIASAMRKNTVSSEEGH